MSAANLDTSVLVDYLFLHLADQFEIDGLRDDVSEPDATKSLFGDGTRHLVVGGKVDGEFSALCDRHRAFYDDVLDWVRDNPDADISEYDPFERDIRMTGNDRSLFGDRTSFDCSGTTPPERLSRLRKIRQAIKTVEEGIDERLDETYSQFDDPTLTSELADLDLAHDTAVVVDAAVIADDHGIDLLVSVDDGLIKKESALNSQIRAAGHSVSLRVERPSNA